MQSPARYGQRASDRHEAHGHAGRVTKAQGGVDGGGGRGKTGAPLLESGRRHAPGPSWAGERAHDPQRGVWRKGARHPQRHGQGAGHARDQHLDAGGHRGVGHGAGGASPGELQLPRRPSRVQQPRGGAHGAGHQGVVPHGQVGPCHGAGGHAGLPVGAGHQHIPRHVGGQPGDHERQAPRGGSRGPPRSPGARLGGGHRGVPPGAGARQGGQEEGTKQAGKPGGAS
jgi:hypothetical protein